MSDLKEALREHELWARKSLGQHFLLDLGLTRRIAALAGDISGRPVLEVGPGPGGLTRALLEAGADPLIAIERDPRFAALLATAPGAERLRLVQADALDVDEEALLAAEGASSAPIVANLPYNVGTPLLVKWLKAGHWRGPMTLMFQLEVAQRIVAKVGEAAYGRLAVLTQSVATASIVLRVPAGAFTPPPKVTSAVVRIFDRADKFDDLDALEAVTAAAFGQRRKMLRSSLKALGPASADLLHAEAIDPTARAEELDVDAYRRLALRWRTLQAAR